MQSPCATRPCRQVQCLVAGVITTPQGTEYSPTVSVGSATLMGALGESHAVVSRGLFDLADQALYEAKETGRDRVVAQQFTIGGALQQESRTGE